MNIKKKISTTMVVVREETKSARLIIVHTFDFGAANHRKSENMDDGSKPLVALLSVP